MARILFHVGSPKCGSSAVQRAMTRLSLNSQMSAPKQVDYWILDSDGTVHKPHKSVDTEITYGYASSSFSWTSLLDGNAIDLTPIVDELRQTGMEATAVLSSEGWLAEIADLVDRGEFPIRELQAKYEDIKFESVMYLRPQIQWLQSAYLQWGVWMDQEVDKFVDWALDAGVCDWNSFAAKLTSCGFDTTWIRYSKNIVHDLNCEVLDIRHGEFGSSQEFRSNESVSLDLLALLIRNRDALRPIGDPRVEFLVGQLIGGRSTFGRPVPFLLGQSISERIASFFVESNRQMGQYVTDLQHRSFMKSMEEDLLKSAGTRLVTLATLKAMVPERSYLESLLALTLERLQEIEEITTC